jgi:hypothetical protein
VDSCYLFEQALILLQFQAHQRSTREPDLLPETDVSELGQLLDVFAHESSPIEATSNIPTVTAAAIHICKVEPETYSVYKHYVAAFGGNRMRPSSCSALPSAQCNNAPCRGCSHPPDLCCICYAPHPWHKCWHMNGLPEREMNRCNEFKALTARGEGPKTDTP